MIVRPPIRTRGPAGPSRTRGIRKIPLSLSAAISPSRNPSSLRFMSPSIRGDAQDHLAALAPDHPPKGLLVPGEREGVGDDRPDLGSHLGPRQERSRPSPGAVDLTPDDPLERHPAEDDVLGVALEGHGPLARQAEEDHLAAAPDGAQSGV